MKRKTLLWKKPFPDFFPARNKDHALNSSSNDNIKVNNNKAVRSDVTKL